MIPAMRAHSPHATMMAVVKQASDIWDAIVIGAGPAGSTAALQLGRAGMRVLLVEKARFPREKVCGCCLNGASVSHLKSLGFVDLLQKHGARATDRFRLHTSGRASTITVPGGFAISRGVLDQALVDAAVDAGVIFQDATTARLITPTDSDAMTFNDDLNLRVVVITHEGETRTLRTRIVLACTGLAGHLLDEEPGMVTTIADGSHMGCAAIVEAPSHEYEAGVIHMALGSAGYVGLVRLEDNRLDVAAALRPDFVQQMGGPAQAVASLLAENHLPPLLDSKAAWRGTPLLTRSRASVASHHLFALGDAASYVEPFTGEGIAWALASARAVMPIALQAITLWNDSLIPAWNRAHHLCLHARQRRCRRLARSLRMARVVGWANGLLRYMPSLARPFVRAISKPHQFPFDSFASSLSSNLSSTKSHSTSAGVSS